MARGEGYYGGGGALGITNPFAQNIPNLADIDKAISEIEHNKLVGEDLRSQIAERAANVAWQQQADDYGGVPGARNGAAPAAAAAPASGGAATLTPYVPRNLPPGVTAEEDLRVRTAYGEAGGEGARGQQAVNSVLSNRVAQSGRSLSDVIFAPGQFEPWNNPTTRAKLEALDPSSPEYQTILANLRAGKDDPTGGATHFYSPKTQAALGRQPPGWGNAEPSAVIGGHNFYRIGYAPGGGAPGPSLAPRRRLRRQRHHPRQRAQGPVWRVASPVPTMYRETPRRRLARLLAARRGNRAVVPSSPVRPRPRHSVPPAGPCSICPKTRQPQPIPAWSRSCRRPGSRSVHRRPIRGMPASSTSPTLARPGRGAPLLPMPWRARPCRHRRRRSRRTNAG